MPSPRCARLRSRVRCRRRRISPDMASTSPNGHPPGRSDKSSARVRIGSEKDGKRYAVSDGFGKLVRVEKSTVGRLALVGRRRARDPDAGNRFRPASKRPKQLRKGGNPYPPPSASLRRGQLNGSRHRRRLPSAGRQPLRPGPARDQARAAVDGGCAAADRGQGQAPGARASGVATGKVPVSIARCARPSRPVRHTRSCRRTAAP